MQQHTILLTLEQMRDVHKMGMSHYIETSKVDLNPLFVKAAKGLHVSFGIRLSKQELAKRNRARKLSEKQRRAK